MKKIFAVNSGHYSDYSVDALFSTRKKAEEFMAIVACGDYNEIEEYEIDPPSADKLKRGYSVWMVLMLKDGNTERVEATDNDSYDVASVGHYIWKRSENKFKPMLDCLSAHVWAKTEKQAIKITNEKRTQMIASGEWV